MPAGKGGGKGKKRRGGDRKSREPPMAEEGQEYARVTAMLGNGRVRAKFSDGTERTCRIRGSMRRREWVHAGDLVLVALRDLAGDKADVVFRYHPQEVQKLHRLGEPVRIAADDDEAGMDVLVAFEGGDDDDDDGDDSGLRRQHAPDLPSSDDEEGWDLL